MHKKIYILFLILGFALIFSGCTQNNSVTNDPIKQQNPETYCNIDEDCACGVHKKTGEAFTGNKEYVDSTLQNPDQCTGWGGVFELKCVQNKCTYVEENQSDKNYDDDNDDSKGAQSKEDCEKAGGEWVHLNFEDTEYWGCNYEK